MGVHDFSVFFAAKFRSNSWRLQKQGINWLVRTRGCSHFYPLFYLALRPCVYKEFAKYPNAHGCRTSQLTRNKNICNKHDTTNVSRIVCSFSWMHCMYIKKTPDPSFSLALGKGSGPLSQGRVVGPPNPLRLGSRDGYTREETDTRARRRMHALALLKSTSGPPFILNPAVSVRSFVQCLVYANFPMAFRVFTTTICLLSSVKLVLGKLFVLVDIFNWWIRVGYKVKQ